MGNWLAVSGRIIAADRHFVFRFCGAGYQAANQKNRGTVNSGYHKASAVTRRLTKIYEKTKLYNNLSHA